MLAYMNRESMKKTLETGYTWFWSRSRQELWNKGATSGHLQKVVSIYGDCDDDTLLVKVIQTGAACHTGNHSCFFNEIKLENKHSRRVVIPAIFLKKDLIKYSKKWAKSQRKWLSPPKTE